MRLARIIVQVYYPSEVVNSCCVHCLQAEYFGFGISVDPAQLDPVDRRPIETALRRVLIDPLFKV